MTVLFRTHGLDVECDSRRPGYLYAFNGTVLVGEVSPWVYGQMDGPWYARRTGKRAVKVATRHEALAHIVCGCPDCHCDDDTCVVCVNGCPEDKCEAN